jgi:L-lactate dehydrogenase complex protein LldG
MTSSRDKILNKLRAARRPFEDAPPRPKEYLPVTHIDDISPDGLLRRFTEEMERLKGEVFPVEGDQAACDKVLELLRSHNTTSILAWDFACIPVHGLEAAIREAGIQIIQPDLRDEFREEVIEAMRDAQCGVTGVDAAAATTGTLIVSSAPGKGRMPTVLAPVWIPILTFDQIVPRIEDWIARERASDLQTIRNSSNVAFISGPSRTGDIEMELILGVHGSGTVQAVVKR